MAAVIGTNVFCSHLTQRPQAAMITQNAKSIDPAIDDSTWTDVLIHNAIDKELPFVTIHNWQGHVAGLYPKVIENSSWARFDHIGEPEQSGDSVGAIVYNIPGYADIMFAWYYPKKGETTAYCEMKEPGYFKHCDWKKIKSSLKNSGKEHKASMKGFTTKVSINEKGKYKAKFYHSK